MLPIPIGKTDDTFDQGRTFTIPPDVRQSHMAIWGKSGVGKSTLLRNMIAWDIHDGLGVTVVDPHGALIEEVLEVIPVNRTNDVIYFSPKAPTHAIAINIIEPVRDIALRPLMVSHLVSIFKAFWGDSWGPRTEYILQNAAAALMEQPQPASLLSIPLLLTNEHYRARIRQHVADPIVQEFFKIYDEHWDKRFREEAISPVLNKTYALLTNPLLRAVIGQTQSSFDFRWLMDSGKILLCDLSMGALGEGACSLLGSLIVTRLYLAALSREDIPETERRPHILYADEVQNFIHGAKLPSILSQSRKYRLACTIAMQTIGQLPLDAIDAVFGNCATVMSFRVGGEDAEALKREFAMMLPASLLQDLPNYKAYLRTMSIVKQGEPNTPVGPYPIKTFPALTAPGSVTPKQQVINASLARYGRPRDQVEAGLNRFIARITAEEQRASALRKRTPARLRTRSMGQPGQ
jgi:hypothetical protein